MKELLDYFWIDFSQNKKIYKEKKMERKEREIYIAKLLIKLWEIRDHFKRENNIEYYSIIDEIGELINSLNLENNQLTYFKEQLESINKILEKENRKLYE